MMRFLSAVILTMFFASFAMAQSFFGAPTTGTAGASTQILAKNTKRIYLLVQNTGATSLIVKFGSTISGSNEGVIVVAGGSYEPVVAPADSVWIKALSGTPTFVVIQGNQ